MTGDYSQCGEQAIIAEILSKLGISTGVVVDLGAGDGWALSNTRHLLQQGWHGVLIDANNRGNPEVREAFLTAENVIQIVSGFTEKVDVLSIDLDGNDYWILNELLTAFSPTLVVCEVNGKFPREEAKAIAYNPQHTWNNNDYYGMSFGAVELLSRRYGYLIYDYNGLNAFLVRSAFALAPKDFTYAPRFDHPPAPGEWTTFS